MYLPGYGCWHPKNLDPKFYVGRSPLIAARLLVFTANLILYSIFGSLQFFLSLSLFALFVLDFFLLLGPIQGLTVAVFWSVRFEIRCSQFLHD